MQNRRWIALITACVLMGTIVTAGFATDDELQEKQNELQQLNQKIQEIQQKKSATKKNVQKITSKIGGIQTNIRSLEAELNQIAHNVTTTEEAIEKTSLELQLAEQRIDDKGETLNKRLRTMYKTGSIGYVEVLLGASDFSDFLTRMDMVQKIYKHDKNLIEFMREQRDNIVTVKTELELQKDQLVALNTSKMSNQEMLSNNLRDLRSEQQKVKQDLKALEELEDDLLEDANSLTDIIKNLQLKAAYVGGKMMWPTPGYTRITSPFGYRIHPIYKKRKMHTGVDIGVPRGEKISAAQDGTVIYADWYGGYGKCVIIDHGGGYTTLYAHNDALLVKAGDKVKKGQAISKCGSTGNSTGPHLHFEVRENGNYVNPMDWVTPF